MAVEWHAAETASAGRAELMAAAAAKVECELEVLGATAIEDRLQDEVPATIAALAFAGIKIWVLTATRPRPRSTSRTRAACSTRACTVRPDHERGRERARGGAPASARSGCARVRGPARRPS